MTLKSITKGAMPVVVGVLATGLVFRFLGDLPLINDALKGIKGDISGKLFS